MSLIETVPVESATGDVAAIYQHMQSALGMVPNAFRIRSTSPQQLKMMVESVGYYMQHERLSPALLACVRMLVSVATNCVYCIDFNAAMLINRLGWTPEQVAATKADPSAANLPDKDKAMLLFVLKAVRDSLSTTAADVDALRKLGWSDGDIVDGLSHGASMVAGDIVLNALQVDRDY
jgi:uncharacterized peroxidase-related enzyme